MFLKPNVKDTSDTINEQIKSCKTSQLTSSKSFCLCICCCGCFVRVFGERVFRSKAVFPIHGPDFGFRSSKETRFSNEGRGRDHEGVGRRRGVQRSLRDRQARHRHRRTRAEVRNYGFIFGNSVPRFVFCF